MDLLNFVLLCLLAFSSTTTTVSRVNASSSSSIKGYSASDHGKKVKQQRQRDGIPTIEEEEEDDEQKDDEEATESGNVHQSRTKIRKLTRGGAAAEYYRMNGKGKKKKKKTKISKKCESTATTTTSSSSRSVRGGTAAEYYRTNGKGKKKRTGGKGKGKGKGSKQCDDNIITVCGADDCIQQLTYSEATMTNVLEIEWCFNARSPIKRTYDIDGTTILMEESISLMSYLQIADQNGCRDIISGSNLALLGFRWNCGFWEAGCGYTANWMRDSLLGLFVEFVPLVGTGYARYHFTGQECCTDWTAGHLVVQDFEMEEFVLEEGDCPFVRDDTRGTYKMRLSWRHNLVGDDYAARSAGNTQFPPIAQTICSNSADCPNLGTPFIRAPTGCSAPPASPGCPMLDGTFDWTSLSIGPYFSVPEDGYTRTNCGQAQESLTDGLKMGVDRSRPRGDDETGRILTWYIQTDRIVNPENDPLCCSTISDLQAAPYNFAGCNSPSYCRLDWN